MIEQRGQDVIFKDRGYPLGIITDGDELDRPEGSLEDLTNMDYDVETGKLRTRNSTSLSDLLDGFSMPAGYEIMVGGVKLFSFNNPVDREVCLLFIKNTSSPFDVRIYVNTWFNPPAGNTDPVGSNNDYENYISSKTANTWFNEWIELTGNEIADKFTKTGNYTFDVDGSTLAHNGQINYYRGWFAWNATKYNSGTTDKIKNESFACIESYDGINGFTIQSRINMNFTDLGWATNDKVYLIRYPIIVHKALDTSVATTNLRMSFTPEGNNWLVKTNTSVKCLIGQEGNLWFGFANKDVTAIDQPLFAHNRKNSHKYYGWWFDYEQFPDPLSTKALATNTVYYTSQRIGLKLTTDGTTSVSNFIAMSVYLDFFQKVCVFYLFHSTNSVNGFAGQAYHHYSRRIVGARFYWFQGTTGKITTDDPASMDDDGYEIPIFNTNSSFYVYKPLYSILSGFTNIGFPNGAKLSDQLRYLPTEQIYTKATFGVYAQGRMFTSGDSDYPDTVRYSLYNREDVFALQNQRPIDATDRDKNTAMDLLGINPVVFKNRSIHIANIEGETEVGWRLIETKSRVGCPYPRSIARTNYGLTFANDEGYWLLADAGEPINLFRKRRLQAYLALTTRAGIFAEWYGKHSEVWIYVGNRTFWVCKMNSEEKMIGFKIYTFNFTPIDLTIDDNGDLFIIGNNFAYKYNNDDEITNGKDADNTNIVWSYTPNYNTFGRYAPFHHIESIINFKGTNRDTPIPEGSEETINLTVYREANEIIQTKTITYDVATSPESLVIKNNKSDRQRALKIKVNGTLTFLKRLEITEVNSRVKGAVKQVKSGYKEAV